MEIRNQTLRRACVGASLAVFALLCSAAGHAQNDAVLPTNVTQPSFIKGPVLVTMFQGKLDTNNAKVGDTVTLKVKKTLKLKDLEIPSGAKVVGKIENVQSKKDGSGNSNLGIQFETVELKGHKIMPIRGLVVGIGKVHIAEGIGYMGVMGRDGAGSTPGLDPSIASNNPIDDVGYGSSLPGVAVAEGLNKSQTSEMRGIKTDIKLDPTVMVKLELFRPNPAS